MKRNFGWKVKSRPCSFELFLFQTRIKAQCKGVICQTKVGVSDAFFFFYYYRKRGSASYIVREVLLVRERERYREREREREREKDGSDVTIVALKIGDEFTLSLAKNSHNWR